MQQLKAALEAREQAHNLMQSLKLAHAQGRVDARYQEMRAMYAQRIGDAANELQRARARVQAQLLASQARGREAERRARDLGIRVMIGEYDAETAEARRAEYAEDAARALEEVSRMTTALAAESAEAIVLPDAPAAPRALRAPEAPEWAEEVATRLERLPGVDWLTCRMGNALTLAGAGVVTLCAGVLPYWWATLVVDTPRYTLAQLSPVLAATMLVLAIGAATALGLTQRRTRAAIQGLLALGILACWVLTLFDVGTPTVQWMLESAKAAGTAAGDVPFIEAQSKSPAMADALKAILLHKATACFVLPLGAFLIALGAAAQARNRRVGDQ
jgi:hypothetical protein